MNLKHYSLTLLLTGLMLALCGKTHAQTISSHYFVDSCTLETYIFDISGTYTGDSIEVAYGDGTTDSAKIYSSSMWMSHMYTTSGTFTVKAVLFGGGVRIDSITFSQSYTGCLYMWGMLYDDKNSDCSYDAGDALVYPSVTLEVDSAGTPIDTITASRYYVYKALAFGKSYTFKPISYPASYTLSCPSGGSVTASSGYGSSTHAGDLGFTCSGSSTFDVALHGWYTCVGTTAMETGVNVTNSSCATKSGTVTAHVDSRYDLVYAWPSGASISGGTVTWSYSGLDVDSSMYFYVWAYSTTGLSVGDAVTTSYDVTPITGDADTTNNHYSTTDTVRGPFDPNGMAVSPGTPIHSGDRLTYTVHFENTGNAPAVNIHIMDAISDYLDINSMKVVSSSFPVNVEKMNIGGKPTVKFDFPGINLPDTSHHAQAEGFVQFTINTKTGLPYGTVIPNSGDIYFDANKPVTTNTVTSVIGTPAAVGNVASASKVAVFPNPTTNDLTIVAAAGVYNRLQVINNIGQVVYTQKVSADITHINMKSLAPGLYFVRLDGANGTSVQKVEKL